MLAGCLATGPATLSGRAMMRKEPSMRITPAIAAVMFMLTACGGSGSGSGPVSVTQQPNPTPSVSAPSISLTRETSATTAVAVLDYLQTHASGGPWYSGNNREATWRHAPGLARFSDIPTVRIAEGTNDHQRAMIMHAVAMVNRALPYQSHIRMGADAPALAAIDDVPDGQIFVDFARHEDWTPAPDPNFRPTGQAVHRFATENGEKTGHLASHVWIDSRLSPANRVTMSTAVHELLHALGFGGHVTPGKYPESFLRETLPPLKTQLGAIDIAALQAFYGRLNVATDREDLSLDSFGPWESETVNLTGSFDGLSFGVRHRNGVSVPWTEGADPTTALADNPAIQGTATWNGELVGFTPDQRSVVGKAEIGITLATLSGRAEFTEMQSWPAGQEPGALGNGVSWNTGSLGYTITVGGNYIRSTGGDAGVLHGRFYGRSHEGVAGTLERSDLTAAFGAGR